MPSKKDSGWSNFKNVLKDTLLQIKDGELHLVVSSLSFSTALSLIPFLAVVLATFKTIGGLEALYPKVEALLLSNFTEAAGHGVTKVFKTVVKNLSVGKVGTVGAIFLFFASLQLLGNMEKGIHRVWNIKNTRPFFKRFIYQWVLLLFIPLALAIYVGFVSLEKVQIVRNLLPLPLLNYSVMFATLFAVYKFVPNLQVRSKAAVVSSALATLSLVLVHKGFIILVKQFFNYNKIYGSFAAFPLMLIWVLTMWYVILGGVALCASLQKRDLVTPD